MTGIGEGCENGDDGGDDGDDGGDGDDDGGGVDDGHMVARLKMMGWLCDEAARAEKTRGWLRVA